MGSRRRASRRQPQQEKAHNAILIRTLVFVVHTRKVSVRNLRLIFRIGRLQINLLRHFAKFRFVRSFDELDVVRANSGATARTLEALGNYLQHAPRAEHGIGIKMRRAQ